MKKATTKPNKKPTKPPAFISIAPEHYSRIEHYKSGSRQTIFIKLYFDLLETFEFCNLPDETKFHFIGLMMLATRNFNRLPTDSNFLMQKLSANSEINLEKLLKSGLIIAAKRKKTKNDFASIETETETEQETETEKEQQQNGKKKKLFVVSPEKSNVSSAEIEAYLSHCLATGEIENPPAFRAYLESGKADSKIIAFREKPPKAAEPEPDEDALARIGARPKRD
jgi:hypothetical protein